MAFVLYAGLASAAFVVIYLLVKMFKKEQNSKKPKPGTVILHQFHPTDLVANASPPCLKLETFLRMARIPYEKEYGMKLSKKGKVPWIEFNGQEIADSNFCIQFLIKEFMADIDSHLTNPEKAIAHSIRTMLEENTYWTIVYYRWCTDYAEHMEKAFFGHLILPLRYLACFMVKKTVRSDLWSHGIGRHSEQELYGIAERDLLAVSAILGQKKFLFGEKPCLADVAAFAFITSSVWDCPQSPFAELINSKMRNLEEHAQRMKELYYPDWDEIITKKHKSE